MFLLPVFLIAWGAIPLQSFARKGNDTFSQYRFFFKPNREDPFARVRLQAGSKGARLAGQASAGLLQFDKKLSGEAPGLAGQASAGLLQSGKKLSGEPSQFGFDKKPKMSFKPFPVIHNQEIKQWVDFFTQSQKLYTKLWLKRSYRYFPLMEKILQSRGLPTELTAMTLVESALSPRAVSPAQAVGYWQFIPSTARQYGLTINDWIDERQDFQKSAQAAAKYLYKLYGEFGDWLLVMSAYNMGESRLRALIKKHRTKNFWRLRAKVDFPRETALYIPKILAAGRIVKNPELYGWSEFQILPPYSYDVFFIPGGVHLEEIALNAGVSLWKLKKLNPELKRGMAPKSLSLYQMRIPKGTGFRVSQWLDGRDGSVVSNLQ